MCWSPSLPTICLYRQSEIYARAVVALERSTLADWVWQSAALLPPLVDALARHVMAGARVLADCHVQKRPPARRSMLASLACVGWRGRRAVRPPRPPIWSGQGATVPGRDRIVFATGVRLGGKDELQLRAAVEAAAFAEVERSGPEGFRSDAVVKQFVGSGADRSTLFRWVAALKSSGKLGAHLAERVRFAAADRAVHLPSPVDDAAREAAALLSQPFRPEEIAAAGGVLNFTASLRRCVATAEQVLRQATAPDGSIRTPRLAPTASDHLRRCLETAARVAVAMRDLQNLRRFHLAVIDVVRAENPDAAERLLQGLERLTDELAVED